MGNGGVDWEGEVNQRERGRTGTAEQEIIRRGRGD
jgi:hypothetical protein